MIKRYILCIGSDSYIAKHFVSSSKENLILLSKNSLIIRRHKRIIKILSLDSISNIVNMLNKFIIKICINFTRENINKFNYIFNNLNNKNIRIINFGSISEFQKGYRTQYSIVKSSSSIDVERIPYHNNLIYLGIVYGENDKLTNDIYKLQYFIYYYGLQELEINIIYIQKVIMILSNIIKKRKYRSLKKIYLLGHMINLRDFSKLIIENDKKVNVDNVKNLDELDRYLKERIIKWINIKNGEENHYYSFNKLRFLNNYFTIKMMGEKIICEKY